MGGIEEDWVEKIMDGFIYIPHLEHKPLEVNREREGGRVAGNNK